MRHFSLGQRGPDAYRVCDWIGLRCGLDFVAKNRNFRLWRKSNLSLLTRSQLFYGVTLVRSVQKSMQVFPTSCANIHKLRCSPLTGVSVADLRTMWFGRCGCRQKTDRQAAFLSVVAGEIDTEGKDKNRGGNVRRISSHLIIPSC